MQSTSAIYKSIFENGKDHLSIQYRMTINDDAQFVFGNSKLVDGTITESLFGKFSVGNLVSKTLDISFLRGAVDVPRSSKLKIECRISDGESWSEWIPKGTFFTDTRRTQFGVTTIHAYDSALKANAVFMKSGAWTSTTALAMYREICSRLGVLEDSDTVSIISANNYTLDAAPNVGERGSTILEILGYIAVLYGRNWTVDETMHLKLIKLIPESHEECKVGEDLDMTYGSLTIDRVVIYTTIEGNESIRYPNVTDTEWDAMTGHILQANSIYVNDSNIAEVAQRVIGSIYSGFKASAVSEDPALQLGDGITFGDGDGGFVIARRVTSFDDGFSEISAPFEEELDSEYPVLSAGERMAIRTSESYGSKIQANSDAIVLETSKRAEEDSKLSTLITQTAEEITINFSKGIQAAEQAASTELTSYAESIDQYIRFAGALIELGERNSQFKAILDNTRLVFTGADGREAAWFANNELHIKRAVIEETLSIGNWVHQIEANGSYSIVYV